MFRVAATENTLYQNGHIERDDRVIRKLVDALRELGVDRRVADRVEPHKRLGSAKDNEPQRRPMDMASAIRDTITEFSQYSRFGAPTRRNDLPTELVDIDNLGSTLRK